MFFLLSPLIIGQRCMLSRAAAHWTHDHLGLLLFRDGYIFKNVIFSCLFEYMCKKKFGDTFSSYIVPSLQRGMLIFSVSFQFIIMPSRGVMVYTAKILLKTSFNAYSFLLWL
jgi:hypothetical protein